MKVLPLRVEQKRAIFARYSENLKDLPLTMQPKLDCAESNRWLSVALLDEGCGDARRNAGKAERGWH